MDYLRNKNGSVIWVMIALISFITACVTIRFPQILTLSSSSKTSLELSEWAELIFERAKIHLYEFNKTESNISNWKFDSNLIASQNQCYPFQDTYEQKIKAGLISGKDFYPSGISLWSRMDPKTQKKTTRAYSNLCYQVELSRLSENNEGPNTSLSRLSVSIKNRKTKQSYIKNGFLSTRQLITK